MNLPKDSGRGIGMDCVPLTANDGIQFDLIQVSGVYKVSKTDPRETYRDPPSVVNAVTQ
jgi:hypothetical protein